MSAEGPENGCFRLFFLIFWEHCPAKLLPSNNLGGDLVAEWCGYAKFLFAESKGVFRKRGLSGSI